VSRTLDLPGYAITRQYTYARCVWEKPGVAHVGGMDIDLCVFVMPNSTRGKNAVSFFVIGTHVPYDGRRAVARALALIAISDPANE
jgi:hypothetical protein